MRRLQFFEIEDQPWCPAPVRDGLTDLLQFHARLSRQYGSAARRLAGAMQAAGTTRIVDLCSGGGGPWLQLEGLLKPRIGPALEVVLTDLYPNADAASRIGRLTGGRITYHPEPVDATRLPKGLSGFRTMFASFHHFGPDMAKKILSDAVENRQGIAVFEFTHRSAPALAAMVPAFLGTWAVTPLVRPFRWSRLFWTYVFPAIPAAVFWDGTVSCLRTYSPADLKELVKDFSGYDWDIGAEITFPFPGIITRLIGVPSYGKGPYTSL